FVLTIHRSFGAAHRKIPQAQYYPYIFDPENPSSVIMPKILFLWSFNICTSGKLNDSGIKRKSLFVSTKFYVMRKLLLLGFTCSVFFNMPLQAQVIQKTVPYPTKSPQIAINVQGTYNGFSYPATYGITMDAK